jgi:hypothetical protein
MTVAQLTVKEDLCRRILDLPDEDFGLVKQYVDDLEAHEPNEETIAAMKDVKARRNLSKIYNDVDEMMNDILKMEVFLCTGRTCVKSAVP